MTTTATPEGDTKTTKATTPNALSPSSPSGPPPRHPSEYMRPGMKPWTREEHAYVKQQNTASA